MLGGALARRRVVVVAAAVLAVAAPFALSGRAPARTIMIATFDPTDPDFVMGFVDGAIGLEGSAPGHALRPVVRPTAGPSRLLLTAGRPTEPQPTRPQPTGSQPADRQPTGPAVTHSVTRIASCHPRQSRRDRARTSYVEPPRAVAARVGAAWARIDAWTAAHAPAARHSLRPPATKAQIARAQARTGRRFPPELVASLRRHDGTDLAMRFVLPILYEPLSVEGVSEDWRTTCDVSEGVGATEWNGAYVPFADDHGEGMLFLDARSRRPAVAELVYDQGIVTDGWPRSLTELLERTASALETGRPTPIAGLDVTATVTRDGSLEWDF